jgi:hypothetical protein
MQLARAHLSSYEDTCKEQPTPKICWQNTSLEKLSDSGTLFVRASTMQDAQQYANLPTDARARVLGELSNLVQQAASHRGSASGSTASGYADLPVPGSMQSTAGVATNGSGRIAARQQKAGQPLKREGGGSAPAAVAGVAMRAAKASGRPSIAVPRTQPPAPAAYQTQQAPPQTAAAAPGVRGDGTSTAAIQAAPGQRQTPGWPAAAGAGAAAAAAAAAGQTSLPQAHEPGLTASLSSLRLADQLACAFQVPRFERLVPLIIDLETTGGRGRQVAAQERESVGVIFRPYQPLYNPWRPAAHVAQLGCLAWVPRQSLLRFSLLSLCLCQLGTQDSGLRTQDSGLGLFSLVQAWRRTPTSPRLLSSASPRARPFPAGSGCQLAWK